MSQVIVKTTNGLSEIPPGTSSQVLVGGSSPTFGNVPSAAIADGVIADWGDGSDGAVTISTTVTLTKSMFYTTLIIANGGVLNTASFPIYALTSVTVQNGGIIQNNGTSVINNLSTGQAGAPAGFYSGGGKGGNTGVAGTNATGILLGGAGGTGGTSSGGAGTAGGVGTITAKDSSFYRNVLVRELMWSPTGSATNTPSVYAPGGGGGGSGTGGSAGGGGGGGILMIKSPTITVNTGGIIQANGGDGANYTLNNTNGGGGGGGGGVISLIYRSYTNSGTVQANGGNGGTAVGGGTGTNGSNGSSGLILTKQLI